MKIMFGIALLLSLQTPMNGQAPSDADIVSIDSLIETPEVKGKAPLILIKRTNSSRGHIFQPGNFVWVFSHIGKHGNLVFKRATLAKIENNQITFATYEKPSKIITQPDSTVQYWAIQTFGSVTSGVIVNTLHACFVVAVIGVVVVGTIASLLTGNSSALLNEPDGSLFSIPWHDQLKHIDLKKTGGSVRWEIRTLSNP
jgi:hypothetical protein